MAPDTDPKSCIWLALSTLLVSNAPAFATDAAADLYQAQVVTTGTGEKNRQIGFALCLQRAVLRVSGDQRLLERPGIAKLLREAGSLVASFSYRDRYSGTPMHDEQGSYDRPHDLTCLYDPKTFDAALVTLGGRPWPLPRPEIAVIVDVHDQANHFVLARDGTENPAMVESLDTAAQAVAMSVKIPRQDDLVAPGAGSGNLEAIGSDREVAAALLGDLSRSASPPGWTVMWSMKWQDQPFSWRAEGVNFDEAFRVGIRGAAQILSGNGQPD